MEKSLLDMREFFLKLLGVSTGVSSRRFIALLMLPSYIIGVFVGIFANNIDFYIPTLHDDETISNIQDTIKEIKKYFENPKITLILNKAKSVDFNEVKKQFINIFGSEKYNYKSNYQSIVNDIRSIAIIPETHLIYLMKNHYRIEMADLYLSSKDLNENEATYRSKWKIEAKELNDKEHYHSKMELLGFGVELIDFIENCKKTLKL